MGMLYLPIHDLFDFYGIHVAKYTVRPMDAMGLSICTYILVFS